MTTAQCPTCTALEHVPAPDETWRHVGRLTRVVVLSVWYSHDTLGEHTIVNARHVTEGSKPWNMRACEFVERYTLVVPWLDVSGSA